MWTKEKQYHKTTAPFVVEKSTVEYGPKSKGRSLRFTTKLVKIRKDAFGLDDRQCDMHSCHFYDKINLCEKTHNTGDTMLYVQCNGGNYYFCPEHTEAEIAAALISDSAK